MTQKCFAFRAVHAGRIWDEDEITAKDCDYGIYASNGGLVAVHPSGFSGNNTDYSPAASGSLGNNGGMIARV